MSFVSVTGVTIAIAVVIVLGVLLMSYMSSLVKSAYQIKVDIRSDMEANLGKMEEELGKKSRWMRKELGEDLEKMKRSLEQDNQSRLAAIEQHIRDSITDLDTASVEDRRALRANIQTIRKKLAAVEQEVSALKEEAARRVAIGRPRWDRETAKRAPSGESGDAADADADVDSEAAPGSPPPEASSPPETVAEQAPAPSPAPRSTQRLELKPLGDGPAG